MKSPTAPGADAFYPDFVRGSTYLLIPLIVILIIGFLYYFISGGPRMPGYSGEDAEMALMDDAVEARRRLAVALDGVTREGADIQLTNKELRDVVLVGLSRTNEGKRLLELSKGVSTQLEEGKLTVGVKFDFAKVLEDMTREERQLFEKAVIVAPILSDRQVVVGFAATPEIEQGRLTLDPGDTVASVSIVDLSLDTWLERLGKRRSEVEKLLQFKIPGYRMGNMRVDGEQMTVRMRKT